MSHADLVEHCIQVLKTYNESMQSLDAHLNKYLKFHSISDPEQQTFVTEVFSGCIRYGEVIKVVIDAYYNTHGKRVLRSEQDIYKVFCYLSIFRLDELGMVHFRKFIRTQNPKKIHKFLSFILDERNIITWMKDEWTKLYDLAFVQKNLISPVQRWIPELQEMLQDMSAKLEGKQESPKPGAQLTRPEPFNLTQPRPRSIPVPEPIPTLEKHKPIRPSVFREPKQFAELEATKEVNRRKAEQRLMEASKEPFACANPEKSEKTKRKIEAIVAEENSKLQFDKKKSHQLPINMQNTVPVKLTTATILKEGAFYKKQEEQVLKKLEALEAGARDPSNFLAWQSRMRQQDMDAELQAIERRRLEGKISHEEAIISRQRIAEENQHKAEQMREEARQYMQNYMKVKVEEEKEMRRLVEAVLDTRYNAKESKKKLQDYKKQLVQAVHEESRELARQALEEAEEDMRRKVALIQEIRAFEAVATSGSRQRSVDLSSTPGYGLLSEMSIVELRERLAWVKSQQQQEEEERRDDILSTKQARDQKLMDTLAVISKHRQEKTRSAAVRLEEKKATHGQRVELQSAELSQLQQRLEEKRAERRSAQRRGKLVPNQASARRTATLIRDKQCMEESRWEELEKTRERQAADYSRRIQNSNTARSLLAPNPVTLKS